MAAVGRLGFSKDSSASWRRSQTGCASTSLHLLPPQASGLLQKPSPVKMTTNPYFTVKTPAGTRGQRSTRPLHHPSPVSGVDPAGVVVNVVDVVDFAIKVSGFLPAFRKWQLGAGHVSRVSTYRAPVCAESYRREARLTHHHHRHHQQEQHQVPKHPPVRRRTV